MGGCCTPKVQYEFDDQNHFITLADCNRLQKFQQRFRGRMEKKANMISIAQQIADLQYPNMSGKTLFSNEEF